MFNKVITSLVVIVICAATNFAQVNNQINTTPRVLYQDYCGLDYAMESVTTHKRGTINPSTTGVINSPSNPPYQVNIAGIPAGAVILEARIWFTVVGLGSADPLPTIQFSDPTATPHTYSNGNPDYLMAGYYNNTTGWSSAGFGCGSTISNATSTYTIDITSTIPANPNGTYTFNSFPSSSSAIVNALCGPDTDGFTLLIVYRDTSSTQPASIAFWDGAVHVPDGGTGYAYPTVPFPPSPTPGNDQAIMIAGDAEFSHSVSLTSMLQPAVTTSPERFWNQMETTGTFDPLWANYTFSLSSNMGSVDDDLTMSVVGVYVHGTNQSTVTATSPVLTVCDGQEVSLGTKYGLPSGTLPVNDLFWTSGFFTPTDPYTPGGTTTNGAFTSLPLGTTNNTITNVAGTFTGYNFNPSLVPVPSGPHTLVYEYDDPLTGCSSSASMDIFVEEADWHQTSSLADAPNGRGDRGFDVFVDKAGYVYSTGAIYRSTTFDDGVGNVITVNPAQGTQPTYYTVCHNSCGELQWVMYDNFFSPDSWSEGFGIGGKGDHIMIGMNYSEQTEIITLYPGGGSTVSSFNGSLASTSIGSILVLKVQGPNTGMFGEVSEVFDNYENYHGEALYTHTINGSSNETFICGKSDQDVNGISNVFASKLSFSTGSGISLVWTTISTQENTNNVANDIRLDPVADEVYLTGTFTHTLTMSGVSAVSGAVHDAFMGILEPSTGAILGTDLHAFGIGAGQRARGMSLTSKDGEYIYFGGNFRGTASNPFGGFYGGTGSITSTSNLTSSYIFSHDRSALSNDLDEIYNTTTSAILTGMDANDQNDLVFAGYYGRGTPLIGGATSAVTNPVGSAQRLIFIGEVEMTPGAWNQPTIVNSTDMNLGEKYDHRSSRVSCSNQWSFTTGTYKGALNSNIGTPNSGPIVATDIGGSTVNNIFNAFILRQNLSNNNWRFSGNNEDPEDLNDDEIQPSESESTPILAVFPNPTAGFTTIRVNGYSFEEPVSFCVFDLDGRIVLEDVLTLPETKLDLRQFESGVYLIKVKADDKVLTTRLIHH